MRPKIEPKANPGSIVFVTYSPDCIEVLRFGPLPDELDDIDVMTKAANADADYTIEHPGAFTVCFDGDTGEPMVAMGFGAPLPDWDEGILRA